MDNSHIRAMVTQTLSNTIKVPEEAAGTGVKMRPAGYFRNGEFIRLDKDYSNPPITWDGTVALNMKLVQTYYSAAAAKNHKFCDQPWNNADLGWLQWYNTGGSYYKSRVYYNGPSSITHQTTAQSGASTLFSLKGRANLKLDFHSFSGSSIGCNVQSYDPETGIMTTPNGSFYGQLVGAHAQTAIASALFGLNEQNVVVKIYRNPSNSNEVLIESGKFTVTGGSYTVTNGQQVTYPTPGAQLSTHVWNSEENLAQIISIPNTNRFVYFYRDNTSAARLFPFEVNPSTLAITLLAETDVAAQLTQAAQILPLVNDRVIVRRYNNDTCHVYAWNGTQYAYEGPATFGTGLKELVVYDEGRKLIALSGTTAAKVDLHHAKNVAADFTADIHTITDTSLGMNDFLYPRLAILSDKVAAFYNLGRFGPSNPNNYSIWNVATLHLDSL